MSKLAQVALRLAARKVLGNVCMQCGIQSPSPQVDHILPRSQFPHLALDPHNVQILCPDCNRDKGDGVFTSGEYMSNELDKDAIRLEFIARLVTELDARGVALEMIEQANRQNRRNNRA